MFGKVGPHAAAVVGCRAMGEKDEMKEQAARAVEEALRQRTVGLLAVGERQPLGAGTLVDWNGRQLVLTAEHVIAGTSFEKLRFFLPTKDIPQNLFDRDTLLSLTAALPSQLADVSELAIAGVKADAEIDLAAIDIASSLTGHESARFFTIAPGGTTPPEGTSIVSRGFPFDLTRTTVDNLRVAIMFVHWGGVVAPRDGLENFNPEWHFLTDFDSEHGGHPKGMSGSAGCYSPRKRDDQLWVADLEIAGVTVTYREKDHLLKLVRREQVEAFLTKHFCC
jgi:hypothetical protein